LAEKEFDEESRAQKAFSSSAPCLFDWFEVRVTQCPARPPLNQLEELVRTTIRWKSSYRTAPDSGASTGLCAVVIGPKDAIVFNPIYWLVMAVAFGLALWLTGKSHIA